TQKPLALLSRIILASTDEHDWILDPFAGSSTTGIAASLCGRRYLGIEKESDFANLGKNRREELNNHDIRIKYQSKLSDLNFSKQSHCVIEPSERYGIDLPF
ncbi:MAG: site-specific DNA-methyltransferase, partial [Muribaculaceae bacterium]|nr:site-specific DNA-methyltransferase [Muribaculaceae bacterium]